MPRLLHHISARYPSMNPSKKLQVYIYTLIIAVLRLQLTVDRNEEC